MSNFEIWWKSYKGFRKKNKAKCQKKFEAYPVETQRIIWVDTQERLAHWHDWQDETFIHAPEVYLNQEFWECPVEKLKRKQSFIRETSMFTPKLDGSFIASECGKEALAGLRALMGKTHLEHEEQTEAELQARKRVLAEQSESLR